MQATVIANTTYTYPSCNKVYNTQEEAEECLMNDTTCCCLKPELERTIIDSKHHKTDWSKDGDVDYFYVAIDWKRKAFISYIKPTGKFGRPKNEKVLSEIIACPFCGRAL